MTGAQGPPGQAPATFVVGTEAELRTALAMMPEQGGTIIVLHGTHILNTPIIVNQDNVAIEGEGPATTFQLAPGANCPCFIIGDPTCVPQVTRRNIALRRMRINGNRGGQASECWAACPCAPTPQITNNCVNVRRTVDAVLEDLIVESARSGGIVTEKGCDSITINRVIASDHFFDGIACYVTTHSSIIDCTSRNNLAAGLSCDLGFRDNVVSDCYFINNGSVGVFWRDCTGNILANSHLSGNAQDGIFVADGDSAGNPPTSENIFEANFYTDNGRNGFWQAGAHSINNVLDGGLFQGNANNAIEESFPLPLPNGAPLIQYNVTVLP